MKESIENLEDVPVGETTGPKAKAQNKKSPPLKYYYPAKVDEIRKHADWFAVHEKKRTTQMRPDDHVLGLRGLSVAQILDSEQFIKMVHNDTMHFIWLHIIPELRALWFGSQWSHKDFNLSKHKAAIDQINGFLEEIRPPSSSEELPKDIDPADSWKAAVERFWALYLASPLLEPILPPTYFDHFAGFVEVLRYLSGPDIVVNDSTLRLDLDRCKLRLEKFVADYKVLYGQEAVSLSVHMLLHLVEDVHEFGPIWASNCFAFETANHWLIRKLHGKRVAQDKSLLEAFMRSCTGQELIDTYSSGGEFRDELFWLGHAPTDYVQTTWCVRITSPLHFSFLIRIFVAGSEAGST